MQNLNHRENILKNHELKLNLITILSLLVPVLHMYLTENFFKTFKKYAYSCSK